MENRLVLQNDQLIKTLSDLYLDETVADVHFKITSNGQVVASIPAHKCLLAKFSPRFFTRFYGATKEEGDVVISNATEAEFKEFLQYFYLHEVVLTFENIATVMKLADYYLMTEFLNFCGQFLIKYAPIKEICSAYQLAINYSQTMSPALKEFCEKKFRENLSEIFQTEGFIGCSKQVLENLLKMDHFSCKAIHVLDACMCWAKMACEKNGEEVNAENLRAKLGDCIYLIPIDFTQQQFWHCIQKYEIDPFHSEEFKEIFTSSKTVSILAKYNRKPVKEWQDENTVVCDCKTVASKTTSLIGPLEKIIFSTNRKLLLKKICIPPFLQDGSYSWSDMKAKVIVIEHTTYEDCIEHNILLIQNTDLSSTNVENKLILDNPIVCDANESYEIQFELKQKFQSGQQVKFWANFALGREVYFGGDKEYKCTFNDTGIRGCFISQLHFNPCNYSKFKTATKRKGSPLAGSSGSE